MPSLLAPENLPYAVALALLALLVLVNGLGMGHFFPDADAHGPEVDHADIGGGLLSMLGIGKLPLIVWLSFFLAVFALLGLSIQQLWTGIFGGPIDALPGAGLALVAALPVNAAVTGFVGRIWPRDETTALRVDALVGRRGSIAIGTARRGDPARATVHDHYGQLHNVMVEPHVDGEELAAGREILLVRREGEIFFALGTEGPLRLDD